MTVLQTINVGILGLFILLVTIEFIRERKLKEEYSLLWLAVGSILIVFIVFPELLYSISNLLFLHHLTTLLMVTFTFLMIIVFHFSIVISRQSEREVELAQKVAILEWKLKQLSEALE